jgi:hypothetical protein
LMKPNIYQLNQRTRAARSKSQTQMQATSICWGFNILKKKLEGDENSSTTGLTSKMLNLTFFSWKPFQHLASSTRPGNRKIEMRKDNLKIVKWSFPTFAHSLFRYKSPLWLGSLPIFMLTCKITLSERGILNLKFQNECQQARQWNESLHKAVRIFLPELETQKKTPSTLQKLSLISSFKLIVLLSNLT